MSRKWLADMFVLTSILSTCHKIFHLDHTISITFVVFFRVQLEIQSSIRNPKHFCLRLISLLTLNIARLVALIHMIEPILLHIISFIHTCRYVWVVSAWADLPKKWCLSKRAMIYIYFKASELLYSGLWVNSFRFTGEFLIFKAHLL